MRRSRRFPILAPALFLFFVAAHVCFGRWDFSAPGDPGRSWGASETSSGVYDDNWNSAQHNPESGFRYSSDLKFRAAVPLERIFIGTQYDYGVFYPHDKQGGVDQTHNLNVSATYSVTPRLALSLTENFISSLQPGLVQGANGAPVTISSGGNYIYDAVTGGMVYQLAPRWSASVNGSWDIWQYQQSAIASNNNHQDYAATGSALYALDPRTTVGLNYQYTQNTFDNAGPNDGLNGYANTVYLSGVRRFNPQLSLTINAGYTVRNSQDGSKNSSPSGLASLTYNYGPFSSVALTIAQSLTEATLGATGSFSAQENSSFALQANHRITARLHAIASTSYVYTTFTAPLSGTSGTAKPNEQSIVGHLGLSYDFRAWLSAILDYSHTQVVSSNSGLVAPYSRNLASVGFTLAY